MVCPGEEKEEKKEEDCPHTLIQYNFMTEKFNCIVCGVEVHPEDDDE